MWFPLPIGTWCVWPSARGNLILLCCSPVTWLSYASPANCVEQGCGSCLCGYNIQQKRALRRHYWCNSPHSAATALGFASRLRQLPTHRRCLSSLNSQTRSPHFSKMWPKLNSPAHRRLVVPWMVYCISLHSAPGQCQALHVLCHICQPCADT